ncbi:hypothetical protein AVEN_150924-1 [Araneus ventricosus]|uniref:Uncharacterized protein n=1 Tax=Araneus ventricosus TaxID=182803 RepID=A0A4Y2C8T0_ARAVE|nr:hypothetical protein AVEN_150924-1 [Araneus ventricosus]
MSRFEVTRELYRYGTRNFEPWSDDEGDTRAGTFPPDFRTTPVPRLSLWNSKPYRKQLSHSLFKINSLICDICCLLGESAYHGSKVAFRAHLKIKKGFFP